ncbi:MAG: helix-turn-helix domain-containing protein [Saprospiraceae bacterium]
MSLQDKLILSTIDMDELTNRITSAVLDALADLPQQNANAVINEDPQFLKPTAAGKLIGYGKDFIYKLIKEGLINAYYPGSDVVVLKSELLEYMERKKIEKVKLLKKVS